MSVSQERSPPRISSEILIGPDGKVTISFLTTELLDLAVGLEPGSPKFRKFLRR